MLTIQDKLILKRKVYLQNG